MMKKIIENCLKDDLILYGTKLTNRLKIYPSNAFYDACPRECTGYLPSYNRKGGTSWYILKNRKIALNIENVFIEGYLENSN